MRPDLNIVLGGVGLIKGSIREAGPAMVEITTELNPFLVEDGFLEDAPFNLLHGIIRFGTKYDPHSQVGPIDKKNNELPFAVEIELDPLRRASKDEVINKFLMALIPALFAIASKYDLPKRGLMKFSELKDFPLPKED
ncbi:Imm39 family immunity protein [uncultured Gimesia sp.]|uniref:Imm39 family immunity protein n=1 Tax=uncultured Gimesia sp. TaxID=1678688 RepID=UPI0030DB8F4A|tara:strand:- start:1894 stop:2307 length:414 start_codon:yes stop_codon:yes gene_type:complete